MFLNKVNLKSIQIKVDSEGNLLPSKTWLRQNLTPRKTCYHQKLDSNKIELHSKKVKAAQPTCSLIPHRKRLHSWNHHLTSLYKWLWPPPIPCCGRLPSWNYPASRGQDSQIAATVPRPNHLHAARSNSYPRSRTANALSHKIHAHDCNQFQFHAALTLPVKLTLPNPAKDEKLTPLHPIPPNTHQDATIKKKHPAKIKRTLPNSKSTKPQQRPLQPQNLQKPAFDSFDNYQNHARHFSPKQWKHPSDKMASTITCLRGTW